MQDVTVPDREFLRELLQHARRKSAWPGRPYPARGVCRSHIGQVPKIRWPRERRKRNGSDLYKRDALFPCLDSSRSAKLIQTRACLCARSTALEPADSPKTGLKLLDTSATTSAISREASWLVVPMIFTKRLHAPIISGEIVDSVSTCP